MTYRRNRKGGAGAIELLIIFAGVLVILLVQVLARIISAARRRLTNH